MGIKHRADSGFRKFSAFSKLSLGEQVISFEMPYVSYPRLSSINLGYGTLDRSSPFRHNHFCLVIAHSLDLVFKENLRQ